MTTRDGRPGAPPDRESGVGLRFPHVAEVMATLPRIGWFEVHAENYMGGGPAIRDLERIRRDYPVAVHGVGLSLATATGVDDRHLMRLKSLVDRIGPGLISEHLSWSVAGGAYLNHLLPLPYTEDTLAAVCENVDRAQHHLGRSLLIENPSGYLRFRHSSIPEAEFLSALAARTGCGILCDVNNVYVSAHNLGFDPHAYLDALPASRVREIHLAGHAANDADGRRILIDDHGGRVVDAVWTLYARAVRRFGPAPTLIEWDTALPPLDDLLAEARRADRIRGAVLAEAAGALPA
jgi:uncharacterized protein (UPF0276 family)